VFHIGIDIDGTATDCVLVDQAVPDAAVTYQQDGVAAVRLPANRWSTIRLV
jgi:N-methylhydantoinase A/oxoprolinase/acetone carboxylase beta subunit